MRYSIIFPALFAAGALAAPVAQPQDYVVVTHYDYVTDYVDVYATAPTPTPAAAPVSASAPAQNDHAAEGYSSASHGSYSSVSHGSWGYQSRSRHSHFHSTSTSVSTSCSTTASSTTTSSTAASSTAASSPVASSPVASSPAASSTAASSTSTHAAAPSTTLASVHTPPAYHTPSAAPTTAVAPKPTTSSVAPAAPAPTSSYGGSNDGSPMSGGVSVLSTINKWRRAYGLETMTWDAKLAANALKTGVDGHGVNQKHELNAGSMCQVISPGIEEVQAGRDMDGLTPFEMAYLGGWLCERPGSPALGGNCKKWTGLAGMVYPSYETGHADILEGNDIKIGCAFAKNVDDPKAKQWTGLWVCDLA